MLIIKALKECVDVFTEHQEWLAMSLFIALLMTLLHMWYVTIKDIRRNMHMGKTFKEAFVYVVIENNCSVFMDGLEGEEKEWPYKEE